MPHALLKDFKSNLVTFVASQMGRIEAAIYRYANDKLNAIINELLRKCPPPETLNRIIKQKQSIETLANSFDQKIQKFNTIPQTLEPAIGAGKVIVEILSHLPLPSTIGIPPPYGGVIVSVPVGVIQAQSNLLVFTRKMVEVLEDDVVSINDVLSSTQGIFDPLIDRLKQLDRLVDHCVNNPDAPDDQRARVIDPRLLDPNDLSNRNLFAGSFRRKLNDGEEHTTTLEQDVNEAFFGAGNNTGAGSSGGRDRGLWGVGIDYSVDDIITYKTLKYKCNTDHTSTADGIAGPPGIGQYWDRVLSNVDSTGLSDADSTGLSDADSIGLSDADSIGLSKEDRDKVYEGTGLDNNTGTSDETYTNARNTQYTIRIVNDPDSPSIAPRRRAIALDRRGVAVLKGPYSFSSSEEILKKELKFRIDNQLP